MGGGGRRIGNSVILSYIMIPGHAWDARPCLKRGQEEEKEEEKEEEEDSNRKRKYLTVRAE